ncbi:hypothetical protein D3C78_1691350 [compost metagenome]
MPGMICQFFWIAPRSASISVWLSVEPPVDFLPPRAACWVERLAPPPEGACLFKSAATSSALKSLSFEEADFAVSCFFSPGFLSEGLSVDFA